MSFSLDQPFIFVDLETTGANPERDRITEIGLVAWEGGEAREWSTLVNPQTTIPPFICQLTGISDAMVAQAPAFADIAAEVMARLQGHVFVAHNARFDYGFLRNEFKRAGLDFRARVICTVKLSRKLFPGEYKHNLDAVAARNGLSADGVRHRALTDARLIHQFLVKLRQELPEDTLAGVLADISRQAGPPAGLDAEMIDRLPDGEGVYLIFGEAGQPLYVGRSKQLQRGVLAHFAPPGRGNKALRIQQPISRIEWVSTAGEFGAMLAEAKLLKSLEPSLNPPRRGQAELCAWRYLPNADGSAQVQLVHAAELDFGREAGLYGLYANPREANHTLRKIAEVHKLCLVRLGLEQAGRRRAAPCSAMPLGRCRGACVGKETALSHQARVSAVLAKLALARWPYAGAVLIREQNPGSTACDLHLIDHWRYLGSAANEAEMQVLLANPPPGEFDADIYKLLNKQLREGSGLKVETIS
ncbi:ethanolamine utilization protein [Chitinimonas arctica]|uniref:DNA-directed DNA polymerase n=1 Tax=Chitinimonas arctica TaxID=2594795 RepID=A0A516SKW9_9NEIS|nr:3'-5' exonuclease family protein [Chitinimonas arctica]QDQ28794.1 ethanolamine utilization protein [Chitinimonas arctica]